MEKEMDFFANEENGENKVENAREKALIKKAIEKYGVIRPSGTKTSFKECFTSDAGKLVFWFNTEDDSTHVVIED